MIFFGLVFPMSYPSGLAQWFWLGTAVCLSWLVSFAFRFLVNLAAFWTPNAKGFNRFAFIFAMFFSGFLMPLRLYPEWIQTLALWTPFPHMLNTVIEIYLGLLQGPALYQALPSPLIWVIILVVLAQVLLKTAVRRLVILGG